MNDIVLLNLRISMWSVSRVLPDHEYEVDADKAMVRATKKILECPEYEFLLQLKRSIHRGKSFDTDRVASADPGRERQEKASHPLVLVTYRFTGPADEAYATLVVRLHHTVAFQAPTSGTRRLISRLKSAPRSASP